MTDIRSGHVCPRERTREKEREKRGEEGALDKKAGKISDAPD